VDLLADLHKTLVNTERGKMMKSKALIVGTLTIILASMNVSHAQNPQRQPTLSEDGDPYRVPSDEEIQLLKKDIRSKRKQIIAANMTLTEAEAEKFWPIYEQYTTELSKINDDKMALIKEYVANHNTLTDQQAESYVHRWAAIDESTNQLRNKYFSIFHQVLSGKSTALFFQMDHRLALMIDLQLTSQMPIIEP
jgi:hypothetical protein